MARPFNTPALPALPKMRDLSDNDRAILLRHMVSLAAIVRDLYPSEGEQSRDLPENMTEADLLRRPQLVVSVANRAADAIRKIGELDRAARLASLRVKIEGAIAPIVAAAHDARSALLNLPPAALAAVKAAGALQDNARVPLASLVPAFPAGTTFDQIKGAAEALGFKVARGADKGTFDLLVPLVAPAPPAPKSVPQMVAENAAAE